MSIPCPKCGRLYTYDGRRCVRSDCRFEGSPPDDPDSYHFFVSYSRGDEQIVTPLVAMLRLAGRPVFRDADDIPPGTKWRAELIDAVDRAQIFLLFWCHHSAKSIEVEKEYTQAMQSEKRLTPILLDDTPLTPALSEYQAIDMRGLFLHEEITTFAKSIGSDNIHLRASMSIDPDKERKRHDERQRRFEEAKNLLLEGFENQVRILETRR